MKILKNKIEFLKPVVKIQTGFNFLKPVSKPNFFFRFKLLRFFFQTGFTLKKTSFFNSIPVHNPNFHRICLRTAEFVRAARLFFIYIRIHYHFYT